MAFNRLDRKIALLKIGLSNRTIAEACQVDPSFVSHVMTGRRWSRSGARKVMNFIAEKVGIPVAEFFPGSERRKGEGVPLARSGDEGKAA